MTQPARATSAAMPSRPCQSGPRNGKPNKRCRLSLVRFMGGSGSSVASAGADRQTGSCQGGSSKPIRVAMLQELVGHGIWAHSFDDQPAIQGFRLLQIQQASSEAPTWIRGAVRAPTHTWAVVIGGSPAVLGLELGRNRKSSEAAQQAVTRATPMSAAANQRFRRMRGLSPIRACPALPSRASSPLHFRCDDPGRAGRRASRDPPASTSRALRCRPRPALGAPATVTVVQRAPLSSTRRASAP